MRKLFSSRLWLLSICLFAVAAALLVGTQAIHASGGWSGPGTTPTGNSNCENKTYTKATGNRCGGITWVMRPVDTAHAACIAIGATHYYKLGWLMYTGPGSNPHYTGDIGRSAIKTSAGASLPYRPGIASGSVSWAKAESDYQIAKKYIPAGYPSWPELGEFCWNPDWACPDGECPPPDPPDPDDHTIYGEGNFWADSYLTVSNEVATHSANVSTKEGSAHSDVTIKVSTDSTATVTFRHTMSYDEELWNPTSTTYTSQARSGHAPAASDDFEEIKTKLKIQQYGVSSSSIKDEDFGTGKSGAKSGQDVATTTVSVSPSPGETLSVCQVLTHQSVKYIIKGEDEDHDEGVNNADGTPKLDANGVQETQEAHDDWKFTKYAEDNNVGLTMLCAEVYRPEDPGGDDPNVWAKGENGSTPMFVGETSDIGWHTHAEWEEARRVRGWQAIAFTVPSNVGYNSSNVTGDLSGRGSAGPCDFYRKAGWGPYDTWCSVIGGRSASGDLGESGDHTYSESQTIALQDYVGYKYCASFGYYWEYWYSIAYSGNDNWQQEGKSYWTNYNAACRTIAKKPSATFWNSGVLTNGGIKTSLSPRIVGVGAAQTASRNQFNFLYGSWSEHLAAVGGSRGVTSTFGSGSSLSRGSSSSAGAYNDIYPRSPMTIANTTTTLGNSGIRTSNTLRTRLSTYLSNIGTLNSINSLPETITDGTYIINVTGSLTINRNIKVAGGPYASIYQIPQVVIFVNGDVNIEGGVTEIDAWIIATGTFKSCSNFQSGTTQTASRVYNNNTVCDKQLVVNGPVMANKAELRRSYGSDPIIQGARYTPGEIFNLSGENYLWAYAQAGRYSSSYTEAYSRELAPRY